MIGYYLHFRGYRWWVVHTYEAFAQAVVMTSMVLVSEWYAQKMLFILNSPLMMLLLIREWRK